MFEHLCFFYNQKGLPTLENCVSDLVKYLDFLQVNLDYSCRMLSMYVMVICLQHTSAYRADKGLIRAHCLRVP